MKFVENNVYTAVNADKLRVGDKVICANDMGHLKHYVTSNGAVLELKNILDENNELRFVAGTGKVLFHLAYLVERASEKPKEKSRKYRAFKNIKEFFETWHELYGKEIPKLPFIPEIWLTDKKFPEVFVRVNGVNFERKLKLYSLMIENKWIGFDILCMNYSFYKEGHLIPCGVLIKE